MNLEAIAGLGIAVGMIAEPIKQSLLKPIKARFNITDDAYRIVVWVVVALIGAVIAFTQDMTLAGWNPALAALAIGLAASLPSSVLHALYEGVLGLRDRVVGADEDWVSVLPTVDVPAG